MAARHQLPGMRYFLWMRIASLRTGILTGIYLSCVFVAWLEVANRVAELARLCRTTQPCGGRDLDRGPRNSRAPIPSPARKAFRCGPHGLDTPDRGVSGGGNTFHAARKPHGGSARFRAWRGFLRLRCRARLGIADVRGSSPPAHGSIQGIRGPCRQAPHALISQIPEEGKIIR